MPRPPNSSKQTRLVLSALYERAQSWRYGYELCQQTGLKSGTLYPILMRLSDQGYLEAEWRTSVSKGRPPRHVYRLTAAGRGLAREQKASAAPVAHTGAIRKGAGA